jgi:drug/metabolite transporter (DMT)-like permease
MFAPQLHVRRRIDSNSLLPSTMKKAQRENAGLLVNGNGSQIYGSMNETRNSRKVDQSPRLVRELSQHMGAHPDGPPHSLVGIVLILLGSFAFSCMFLFVKLMQGKANTFVLSFYRGLVEIPIALYLCAKASEHPLGPSSKRNWLLVRGGVGGAAVLCFFFAIQHLPLPDAVTLQFTTPPFAAAFAVFLVGERWMLLDMAGSVVCLLGVMLIAHPSWLFGASTEDSNGEAQSSSTDQSLIAIAVALLGAAFAGLAYKSVRKIGHDASANVMVLYYSCLSLPLTILGSRGFHHDWSVWGGGASFSTLDWCWILFTGVFAYSGQYFINLGLQYETAATGTLVTCSQIVFTYMFESAFLHEDINLWSLGGTVLIVGFMVVVGVCKMKEADETIHGAVAGETEELALLFSAERDVRCAS